MFFLQLHRGESRAIDRLPEPMYKPQLRLNTVTRRYSSLSADSAARPANLNYRFLRDSLPGVRAENAAALLCASDVQPR